MASGKPVWGPIPKPRLTDKRKQKADELSDVDYVPTNTHSSQGESQLHIFEDNEAVIKMIIKERSPTMRHVSRTHRVALDWLFDRIRLGPKIQIKYVNTKNQLADILTKGSFTRDERNQLLRLLNIMNFTQCFPAAILSNFLSGSIRERCAMSKRVPSESLHLKSPLDLFLTWRSAFRSDRQKENHWNGYKRASRNS